MNAPELCFTPATDLVRLFRTRKTSPLEVMHAAIARIDTANPRLNAYVTVARGFRPPSSPGRHIRPQEGRRFTPASRSRCRSRT